MAFAGDGQWPAVRPLEPELKFRPQHRDCGARADQFFGSAFPGLCSPKVTPSVFGPELAAAGDSNGSSCTVPSVMRVVLMPVSGSRWIGHARA